MYLSLMEQGWKLHEIDEMDIGFFHELMEFRKENKKQTKKEEPIKRVTIDQVNW